MTTGEDDGLTAGLRLPSPLVELVDDRLTRRQIRLWVKRDDLIHPDLPGNKWRKLKYNLAAAREQGHDTLLTFGGAYSNHIRATAAAGKRLGLATIAVIRGEEHLPLNPTLTYAVNAGMRLTYLDRATYRTKHTSQVIDALRERFGRFYLLPEGGSNDLAVRGCAELPAEITEPFDLICCPVGTGSTLVGIAAGLHPGQHAIGFSARKGGQFLTAEVERLQQRTFGEHRGQWHIECDFHFGGFAKKTPALDTFITDTATRHRLQLDWVYVAKMLHGLFTLTSSRSLRASRSVPTGLGLPGRAGLPPAGPVPHRRGGSM